MRYAMRIAIPHSPGALGAVATAAGGAGVDILTLDVIEVTGGVAVDDVRVEADMSAQRLQRVFEQVPGVAVEALMPVRVPHGQATPTGLAATLVEAGDAVLQRLVDGLPDALGGSWALAVADGQAGLETIAAGRAAPAVPAGLRLPFLPIDGPRRLPQAGWMPPEWRGRRGEPKVEIAAARLHAPYAAVLLGRVGGARFRETELRRLDELARVAVASGAIGQVVAMTPAV